jgi:hypothetical protein
LKAPGIVGVSGFAAPITVAPPSNDEPRLPRDIRATGTLLGLGMEGISTAIVNCLRGYTPWQWILPVCQLRLGNDAAAITWRIAVSKVIEYKKPTVGGAGNQSELNVAHYFGIISAEMSDKLASAS